MNLGVLRGRRWWWTVAVVSSFVACGGSSSRKNAGNGDDHSPDGGTSGSAGASAGLGAAPTGGTSNTGGRGGGGRGGSTAGKGGRAQGGSAGSSGSDGGTGDTGPGGVGTGGDGGFGGTPICDHFPGGNRCLYEEACVALGCGKAWSNYDVNLCRRDQCTNTATCAAGERCLPAPVAGRFDNPCSNEVDGCEVVDSACECLGYEECFASAVCVPESEFPPGSDCPIADLDCAQLERAASTVQTYLAGDDVFTIPYDVPAALVGGLEACAEAIAGRLEAECN